MPLQKFFELAYDGMLFRGKLPPSLMSIPINSDPLTVPRPEGRGFPLHRAEPKPRYAIHD